MSTLEQLHQKAIKYYEEKDLDNALNCYLEIMKINPIDEVALSCIMDIYLEKDDKVNYYLARANVNISQNKIEYAINDTKKALNLDIDNVEIRKKLARLYRVNKKNLKAVDEFSRVLQMDEKAYEVYFELIDLYMVENAPDSAINIALNGLKIYPDDDNLSNALAQIYFRNDNLKAALEVVKDKLLKIKILLQDNQHEEAQKLLSRVDASELDENGLRNYYILLAQYYYNVKKFDYALENVEKYSSLKGPDAISFQMKALIYEEKEDEENAYINWGFCKKYQGKSDEAIVEFDHAYKINPKNKTALIELAKLYQQNKERYVAIEYWQKVYEIDKDAEAKEILAEFYYSEGDFKKAEQYGKVIEKKEEKEVQQEQYEGLIDKIMKFFTK